MDRGRVQPGADVFSFAAPNSGSYYGKLMDDAEREGRITSVPHDPALKVWTSWDLGIDDSTAIWCCADYTWRGMAPDRLHRGQRCRVSITTRRLLQQRSYVYEKHLLPHDAEVRELGSGAVPHRDAARPWCPTDARACGNTRCRRRDQRRAHDPAALLVRCRALREGHQGAAALPQGVERSSADLAGKPGARPCVARERFCYATSR